MSTKPEWKGLTNNKIILVGVVNGDPRIIDNNGKEVAMFNLAVKTREMSLNGQWETFIANVPILVTNEKRVSSTIKPHVSNGREMYLEGHYISWGKGQHAIVCNYTMNLGSGVKDPSSVPSPEDRKYWNATMNEALLFGRVTGLTQTAVGEHEIVRMGLETEIVEFKDTGIDRRTVVVPITIMESSKVKTVLDNTVEGQTLYVPSYYRNTDDGHTFVAKQVVFGNKPYVPKDKDMLP